MTRLLDDGSVSSFQQILLYILASVHATTNVASWRIHARAVTKSMTYLTRCTTPSPTSPLTLWTLPRSLVATSNADAESIVSSPASLPTSVADAFAFAGADVLSDACRRQRR